MALNYRHCFLLAVIIQVSGLSEKALSSSPGQWRRPSVEITINFSLQGTDALGRDVLITLSGWPLDLVWRGGGLF